MTAQATEAKQPEVNIKSAPKEPKAPAKPKLTPTSAKRLQELTEQIAKLEGLKADRLALMKKEHGRGVATTEIAAAASYSVARTRQLLSK
jgi:hypothetical protein